MEENFEPLTIVQNDDEQVLIKNNCKGIQCAMHGFPANHAFYTITKGRDHVMTIYDESGDSIISWDWGVSGYTLIGSSLSAIQKKVVGFCKERGVYLD